jgi:NAD(P)-dependent dehydrogenase (short-subunit alcohol dehydrogenase family)
MLSAADVETCIRVLTAIHEDRTVLETVERPTSQRLLELAGRVSRPTAREKLERRRAARRERGAKKRERDRALLQARKHRRETARVFVPPRPNLADPDELHPELPGPGGAAAPGPRDGTEQRASGPRACYTCKREYRELHAFYDQLCKPCGDFNYKKRTPSADLAGRTALVTGGRIKIGYHAVLMLLRAGARVLVTTRFPHDATARFLREPDAAAWSHRVEVYGLDLRHAPSVEAFAAHLIATEPRLDFLISNACQTVRRPPPFYAHLMEGEYAPPAALPAAARAMVRSWHALRATLPPAQAYGLVDSALLSSTDAGARPDLLTSSTEDTFPAQRFDEDGQQVDLRETNSWRHELADVPLLELLEVCLVNAIAPTILAARLKPLFLRQPSFDKHIVNVSAMEGQFYRTFKTHKHPHTNMAKAALNMLTRTSASEYAKLGVFMNSVDTGWITDEDPWDHAQRKAREQGFSPPLDVVDGAARIVDPIFSGFQTGEHAWGRFFKDYRETHW